MYNEAKQKVFEESSDQESSTSGLSSAIWMATTKSRLKSFLTNGETTWKLGTESVERIFVMGHVTI